MNFKNIKTEQEFWELSDNWYQRLNRLREVWEDPKESIDRMFKAYYLWIIMHVRIVKLIPIAQKIKLPIVKTEHLKGTIQE